MNKYRFDSSVPGTVKVWMDVQVNGRVKARLMMHEYANGSEHAEALAQQFANDNGPLLNIKALRVEFVPFNEVIEIDVTPKSLKHGAIGPVIKAA